MSQLFIGILLKKYLSTFFIKLKNYLSLSSSLLLTSLGITIFIIPIVSQQYQSSLFSMGFTIIFILSAFSVTYVQKPVAVFAVGVITAEWIAQILNLPLIFKLALPVKFLFFLMIVMILIVQIAKAHKATLLVMLQSISVFLLLGLSFAIIVALLETSFPNSFNFQTQSEITGVATFSNCLYFTFITFTTTGYGDFLPVTPAAKSLAMLIGISGQLYIAIIIAMLVGKYSSR